MAFGFACVWCAAAHSALAPEVKLFAPPDLHAHEEQKAPQPQARLITITSSTTASLGSTVAVIWTTPGYDPDT